MYVISFNCLQQPYEEIKAEEAYSQIPQPIL